VAIIFAPIHHHSTTICNNPAPSRCGFKPGQFKAASGPILEQIIATIRIQQAQAAIKNIAK
jgi:hypothetical protein